VLLLLFVLTSLPPRAPRASPPVSETSAPESLYRGVNWSHKKARWVVLICGDNGRGAGGAGFADEEKAAKAWDAAARQHWDEESMPALGSKRPGLDGFNFPSKKAIKQGKGMGAKGATTIYECEKCR